VSRFLVNPDKQHWQVVKWILKYLKGYSHYCLCFGNNDVVLEGYTYVDMARYVDTRNSTTGYLYIFAGATVSWVSRLQVALSTTKEKYIVAIEDFKDILWMRQFLGDLGIK